MKHVLCVSLLTLLVCLAFAHPGAATTYYVSTSGVDQPNCAVATSPTGSNPLRTLPYAINHCLGLTQGNVLQIRAGTYNEYASNSEGSTMVNWPRGTGWGAGQYFMIQGYPGDAKPVFTQTLDIHYFNAGNGILPQYIWFDNIEVDIGIHADTPTTPGKYCFYLTASHMKITNSRFGNSTGVCISGGADDRDLANTGGDIIFDHNEVHHVYGHLDTGNWPQPGCGCPPGGCPCYLGGIGMYVSFHQSQITNNVIHDTTIYGIQLYHGGPPLGGDAIYENVIANNIIYNAVTNDGNRGQGASAMVDTGYNELYMNNIIYHINQPAGTSCEAMITPHNRNHRLYNNTLADSPNCYGIYFYDGGTNHDAQGNILFNLLAPQLTGSGSTRTFANNFTNDPSFVNTSNGDYRIASTSQARASVGGGCPNFFSAGVTTDFQGEARPSSGNFDCGADQVVAGTPVVIKSQLEFGIQPSDALTNATLTPLPTVRVETSNGSLDTTAADSITLSLVSTQIPQASLTFVSTDSSESAGVGYGGAKAIDSNTSTAWHTNFTTAVTGHPHNIVLSFPSSTVNGLVYTPRLGPDVSGQIAGYNIYVSTDCATWGTAVASGTFGTQAGGKRYGVSTTPKVGTCIKLESTSSVSAGTPYASAAEINVLKVASVTPTGLLTQPASGGIATFTTAIPTAGAGYILKATSGTLNAQLSAPFTITDAGGGPTPPSTDPATLLRYIPGR